jgi:hypothetical protein
MTSKMTLSMALKQSISGIDGHISCDDLRHAPYRQDILVVS